MRFQLRPILSEIKELYLKPASNARFKEYLSKLQGDTKGDLLLPISGFNPMAKDHILEKITELQNLHAEVIMADAIETFNSNIVSSSQKDVKVVLNIADDLKGAWTNFYTTDFDSKFKLSAFVKRKFCVPYFWTSEAYTEELIKNRTIEYLSRTLYCINHQHPKNLEEHLEQEIFCQNMNNSLEENQNSDFELIQDFYEQYKTSAEYSLLFNFFYGDEASDSLRYKKFGIKDNTGFEYARHISFNKLTSKI